MRLVRSKGVGIYFITQNPIDLPETVLGQLGNRVQHALRAFTPRDQKAVRAAAETFRTNPNSTVEDAITQLGVGEALVSVLDATERAEQIERSPYFEVYDQAVDRESAFELLKKAREQVPQVSPAPPPLPQGGQNDSDLLDVLGGGTGGNRKSSPSPQPRYEIAARRPVGRPADSMGEILTKTVVRSVGSSIGSSVGRSLVRGLLGSLIGGRR